LLPILIISLSYYLLIKTREYCVISQSYIQRVTLRKPKSKAGVTTKKPQKSLPSHLTTNQRTKKRVKATESIGATTKKR
jgi:hypothetical protein